MPQTLPYATGAALFKEYKSRHGDKTLLGFSRGKDSIAAAITMPGHDQVERKRAADRIDGYDRDDLGESPDF